MAFSHSGFLESELFSPVALIDIGSNSVRLVVYDSLSCAPTVLFNEKILCGLGRDLSDRGHLDISGVRRCLDLLRRYRLLCVHLEVVEIFAFATAAVRDASDGASFISRAEASLGCLIRILSGDEEGLFSARGVLAAIPGANGIVGDMGGGSLELVEMNGGSVGNSHTFPLGYLRLSELLGSDLSSVYENSVWSDICGCFSSSLGDLSLSGRSLYAVGGVWRRIGRLHMLYRDYPLRVLHHYRMSAGEVLSFTDLLIAPANMPSEMLLSGQRRETVPYGALLLRYLVSDYGIKEVIFSSYGVREGLLYSHLSSKERVSDPLLSFCSRLLRGFSRNPAHQHELCGWTDPLFSGKNGLPESTALRRLRHAGCLLSDIDWLTHPNYRGRRALSTISQAGFVAIDHIERAYLSMILYFRYRGIRSEGSYFDENPSVDVRSFLSDDLLHYSRIIAASLRLGYILSGARPGVLPEIGLLLGADFLTLSFSPRWHDLTGERVRSRLNHLAELLGVEGRVVIED